MNENTKAVMVFGIVAPGFIGMCMVASTTNAEHEREQRIISIEDINQDGTLDIGYKKGEKITPMYGVLNPATGQTEYVTAEVYKRLHTETELDYDLLEKRLNELLAGKVPDTLELELEKREAEQNNK